MDAPHRRLLVATDFSSGSRKAEEVAVEMARASGSRLTLLHVVHLARMREFLDALASSPVWHLDAPEALAGLAVQRLEEERAHLAALGVEVETATAQGEPADEIIRYAREKGFDVVVMGRRGRSPHRPWVGGVAEQVMRASPIAVMLVPEPVPEGASPEGARG